MKKKNISEILRDEIKRIENIFIEHAILNNDGAYWETLFRVTQDNIIAERSETIYTGVGGIILTLKELYLLNKNPKILKLMNLACDWIINYSKANPTAYYAFLTGRLGVAFVLHEAHKVSPKKKYMAYAFKVCKESVKFSEYPNYCYDYINGISGVLLCLTYLFKETSQNFLLEIINRFTKILMQGTKFHKYGVFWDYNFDAKLPLCGLAHGNSGIGLILYEVGKYFNNKALQELGINAIKYEDRFYDKNLHNWEDLRNVDLFDKDTEYKNQKIRENDLKIFSTKNFMNAWCHGAIGIGLARLKFFQLSDDKSYLKDINKVIKLVKSLEKNSNYYTCTLCHGELGNSLFMLKANTILQDGKYINIAQNFCIKSIDNLKQTGVYHSGFTTSGDKQDLSLFNGIAGICYQYINVLQNDIINNDDVFLLSLQNSTAPKKASSVFNKLFSIQNFKKDILKVTFPKTFSKIKPTLLKEVVDLQPGITNTVKYFKRNVLQKSDSVSQNDFLSDLIIENTIFEKKLSVENLALIIAKQNFDISEAQNYDFHTREIETRLLVLNSNISIIKVKKDSGLEVYLLIFNILNSHVFRLNKFNLLLLNNFKKPGRLIDFFGTLKKAGQKLNEGSKGIILQQVREFIKSGILIKNR
ncbi:MAG: hypothetical protein K1X86_16380 [Ignavibacteria bacterium]|nr:hypothetical protein [Ignavibacteria bacterium]